MIRFCLLSFLMCPSEEDLKRLSKWEGKTESSRQKLMDKLQGKRTSFY